MAKNSKNKIYNTNKIKDDGGNNLKVLKFIVHFMGVLLIGGIILLFILVIQRNQEKNAEKLANSGAACQQEAFTLPQRGNVKSIAKNEKDNTMTIVLESYTSQHIVTVDLCKFNILSQIIVNR